jgi:hypothetical protein
MQILIRSLTLFAIAALLSACRHPPTTSTHQEPRRGDWEVRRHGDAYRATFWHRVQEDRIDIIVATTDTRQSDWGEWILWGNDGAESRLTYIFDGSGTIRHWYDHLTEETDPAAFAVEKVERPGFVVGHGTGITSPARLPLELRTGKPGFWLGIYGSTTTVALPGIPEAHGITLSAVGAKSGAAAIGMQVGDILVRAGPWGYDHEKFAEFIPLVRAIQKHYLPGDTMEVEYLRGDVDNRTHFKRTMPLPEFPTKHQKLTPELQAAIDAVINLPSQPGSPEADLLRRLAVATGRAEANTDLMKRLADSHVLMDPYRLWPMIAAHTQPFESETVANHCIAPVLPLTNGPALTSTDWISTIYLSSPVAKPELPAFRGTDLDGHVAYITAVITESAKLHELAIAAFSDDERAFVGSQMPGLLEGFSKAHMMWFDSDAGRQDRNVELGMLMQKLDWGPMQTQAQTAALLLDDAFIDSLRGVLSDRMSETDRIVDVATDYGRILIGGAGDDHYMSGDQAAVLIDLGGNDFYANNTGSSIPGELATAILIDLGGDDAYENWRHMRQGCGFFGVGMLADLEGDDSYIGVRGCQGTGFAGIGILADWDGDDTYRSIDYGQGVGEFGAGLLVDKGGNNRYEGHLSCQGVGFVHGIGVVYSAGADSNDFYYNKGQTASGYGDAGSFAGWGQGVGIGHRPYFSGGIGMIIDAGGDDEYHGGTFSTGGGYYYGIGIVNDRGNGSDKYRGTRYNMGFTAHQAVGIFIEDGGNDNYLSTHFVASGMAWDESTTLLLDRGGDDTYTSPGFAHSASAMNGFTMFIDRDGADRYIGQTPAQTHGNSYHKGTSIAYFLDLGGGIDDFGTERQAGEVYTADEHAFFIDAPSIPAALEKVQRNEIRDASKE